MTGSTGVRSARGFLVCLLAVVAVGLFLQAASTDSALAQEGKVPGAADMPAIATLTGKIVDLQCYMTGKHEGDDPAKCAAACIKSGVPVALETKDGLVILGHGMTGAAKMLEPLAMQEVEVKGKLYEKGGVKYVDVLAVVKKAEPPAPAEEEADVEEEKE
ncbi:MAG: hypothetical protein JXB13_00790 [Phycisphaerae bacterium]|nr:hypothetical protein [Phycisphaerae bacterium]